MNEAVRRQFESSVLRPLCRLGWRLRAYVLLDGLAVLSVALVLAILVTLAVDYTARLGRDMRVTQLASIIALLAAIGWWWVARPLRRSVGTADLALLVERHYPQAGSLLISAVEFARGPVAPPGSPVLAEAVVRQAADEATGIPFHAILEHRRARRRGVVTLASLAGIAVLGITARDTMGLWLRRNVLLQDISWPLRNRLTLENLSGGRLIVPRNEDVTVSAVVDRGYEPPRQAFIEFEGAQGQAAGREQMPATMQEQVRFTHTFERLAESLRCRIVGGDAETEWFELQVVDRPQVKDALIEVAPPAYTRMEPYQLRAGQTAAEVLAGSEVRFQVLTNKPVVRATLVRQDASRETEIGEATGSDGLRFRTAVKPAGSSSYQFNLVDEIGLTNRSERLVPVRFGIRVVADKAPVVKMRIKDVGEMITTQAVLPVEGSFSDQYGLAGAGVGFEIARDNASPSRAVDPIAGFEPGSKTFARTVDWSAGAHGVAEGDRLNLFCQASDFDNIGGPNLGKSAVLSLRVVSQEELLAELGRREQEHRRDFERLVRQQEELLSDLLATARAAGPAEAREYFPRLARRQRDHAGRLNLLRLQFEQVLAKLRMNRLATAAVEARLGQGVIMPMDSLYRETMPRAAGALDQLPPEAAGATLETARAAQERVLAEMNRILASLLKWEGYQEAVTLLRDVLKMQKDLGRETEGKVEAQILGTQPEPGAETRPGEAR